VVEDPEHSSGDENKVSIGMEISRRCAANHLRDRLTKLTGLPKLEPELKFGIFREEFYQV
jgi:hypothetical protein